MEWHGYLVFWCEFGASFTCSIEDLTDTVEREGEYDLLSPFLVPYYSNKRMDEVAEQIWLQYIPEALTDPTKRIASELAKRMGLTIQYHPVYEHRGVDSILFFAEDDLVRGTDRMEKGDNGKKERMPEDPDHVSLHDVAEEFEITVMKARKLLITGKLYRDVRGPDAQVCGAWSEHCGPGPFDYRQRQRHVQREEPRLHRVAGAGDPG